MSIPTRWLDKEYKHQEQNREAARSPAKKVSVMPAGKVADVATSAAAAATGEAS